MKPSTLHLPLAFLPDEGNFIVQSDGAIVGEIPCQGVLDDKQVGTYIVHACNAYPELVENVKSLRFLLRQWNDSHQTQPEDTRAIKRAAALLAKIGEGG